MYRVTNLLANFLLLLLFPIVSICMIVRLLINWIIGNLLDLVPRIDKGDAWEFNIKIYDLLFK